MVVSGTDGWGIDNYFEEMSGSMKRREETECSEIDELIMSPSVAGSALAIAGGQIELARTKGRERYKMSEKRRLQFVSKTSRRIVWYGGYSIISPLGWRLYLWVQKS